MGEYQNVKKLISWAEAFENQLAEGDIWDDTKFAHWLAGEFKTSPNTEQPIAKKSKASITMSVHFLYKFAQFYSRKIFKNSLIYSLDDFSVIASLLPDKKLMKAEVIRKNITEKSSGNEVLKRLLRQQLIKETDNPEDRRSKLLEITPQGLNEIFAIKSQMERMGELVEGNLNEQEKIDLLKIFSKLYQFHNPLFEANDESILFEKLGISK